MTTVAFLVFIFFLPETNARRPGLLARGRRTCTSVPSIRSFDALGGGVGEDVRQGAQPQAGRPGTANPRAASSGRISRTARVTVERSTR